MHLNLSNGTDRFYFQDENRSRVDTTALSVNNNHDRKFASYRLNRSLSKRLDPHRSACIEIAFDVWYFYYKLLRHWNPHGTEFLSSPVYVRKK